MRKLTMVSCANHPTEQSAATGVSASHRYEALDVARGCAVLGMIYMHLVPTEGAKTLFERLCTGLARLIEGKSAALFCVLAGAAWAIQADRAHGSPQFPRYVLRRALALAAVGLLLHARIWPTEILLPIALMMVLALAIRRANPCAPLLIAILLLLVIPLMTARFGAYVQLDWNEDGSHVADSALSWATLRFLLYDGNYPLLPWLAFPLFGMVLVTGNRLRSSGARNGFWIAAPLAVIAQRFAAWTESNTDRLGDLAPYLANTWVPTSIPYVILTGSSATALIAGLCAWQGTRSLPPVVRPLAYLGRASLTHYLLHICVLVVPLRLFFPAEEWPISVGIRAFALYIALALPLTSLWFRRFSRGPCEGLWALASGRSRET